MALEATAEISQFFTFILDKEIYAFEISRVREVLDSGDVTRVPKMPNFMRGVINLRGKVVPVIDLRLKFGMTETKQTVDTCIIIIEISLDGETTILGAMADSVQEVLNLEVDQIESAPKIGTRLNTEFIRGMGKKDNEFIIILDVDSVFSGEELATVQGVEGETVPVAVDAPAVEAPAAV
jgi:purine-binding chemotaxis protein CheW